jgi:hypothetical protein
MFLISLATLSFASSLMPVPETQIAVAGAEPHPWVLTFE